MYESQLLDNARLAGHGHVDGRRLNDLELLTVLQHHGAATRLLDFTENVLVAAWFASHAYDEGHGLLIGIDLTNAFWVRREAEIEQRFEALLEEAERRLVRWKPGALSGRIPAQSAFHVFSQVVMHEWGSLASGAADYPHDFATSQITEEMAAIAVSPGFKANLRQSWRPLLGYSESTLFPDLAGFSSFNSARQELGEDFLGLI